jgi:GrpB-like predicted nucleotidyltransferase (UPF0157 family)
MKKTLKDLTKSDWNMLFPIELQDHNPAWKTIFQKEKELIISKIGTETVLKIEHFGSSAINRIKSKPYIDILIEIRKDLLFDSSIIRMFEDFGYSYFKVPQRENIDAYMSFGKGYNLSGDKEQIYHIHMCPRDNVMWEQTEFRDYLNANYEWAKKYEELKMNLASQFKNDRGAYVLGKTKFIAETMDMIKKDQ